MSQEPDVCDPDELEINKAAYLSVHERDVVTGKLLTQDKVADRLGTTREQVNRYLQRAKKQGILRTEYVPPSDEMQERVILALNHTNITEVLQEYAEHHRKDNKGCSIQSVTVVCEELPCNRGEPWDDSLLRFAPLTAVKTRQFLRELMKFPSPMAGLGWGRMLRCAVDQIHRSDFSGIRGKRPIRCIPLWGGVWGAEIPEWTGDIFTDRDRLSSSTLARDLETQLNKPGDQKGRRFHSLEAVPVMLPRELAEHKTILFQYLNRVSAWGKIFGNHESGKLARNTQRPLADRLQLILGAVGSPKTPGRFLTPEVLRNVLSEQDARRLLRVVDGDVLGVLMEKPGLDKTDRKFLDGIHDGWTGVREEHLRQCTEKASAGKAVGVVLYAIHKSRARPILSAIRRGIVSHLVTEMGLAVELKRLVEQELRASR